MRVRIENDWRWRRRSVVVLAVYLERGAFELTVANITLSIVWED